MGIRNILRWGAALLAACLAAGVTTASAQAHKSDAADDALQFVPYAAVLALKAGGLESRDEWPRLAAKAAASFAVSAGAAYVLKHAVREERPDGSDRRSFPSGHATFAFAGATLLHHEFGRVSPWISVGGYAAATLAAVDRVRRDRHHWHDVAAGAGIGILSAGLSCRVADRLFPRRNVDVAFSGAVLHVAVRL